eukprot:3138979-Alexandrium_andersonii.AAC.1
MGHAIDFATRVAQVKLKRGHDKSVTGPQSSTNGSGDEAPGNDGAMQTEAGEHAVRREANHEHPSSD